jgi:hypothetical protein
MAWKISGKAIDMVTGVLNFVDKTLTYLVICNGAAASYVLMQMKMNTVLLWGGAISFSLGVACGITGYVFAYLTQNKFKDNVCFIENKLVRKAAEALNAAMTYKRWGIVSVIAGLAFFLLGVSLVAIDSFPR